MKTLLQLTGIMLCAATLHGATADPAASLQTKQGEELHAAITDMPDIVDMSYADPSTWNSLPPAAQVYDHFIPTRRPSKKQSSSTQSDYGVKSPSPVPAG